MNYRKLIPAAVAFIVLLATLPTVLTDPDTLTLVGSPTTNYAGMSVAFTEKITGSAPSDWPQTIYYGDGSNATLTETERPSAHRYADAGTYTAYIEWIHNGAKVRSNNVVITVNSKPTTNFTSSSVVANGFPIPSSLNEDLDYGWANAYANGTVYHDSSVKHDGEASLRIIANADGSACEAAKNISIHELGKENFRLFVRSDDWADVRGAQIIFAEDSTMAKFFYLNLLDYCADLNTDNEWYELTLPRSEFESHGGPDWNNTGFVMLRGWSADGKTPAIHFDTLQTFKQGEKGHVSVVFDDGWDTQYSQAFTYMQTKGIRGNIFVVPSLVDKKERVTQSDLDNMSAAGWDISGHGEVALTPLTESQLRSDVKETKKYLDGKGYKGRNIYAYPEGQNNELVRSVVGENFEYARTINAFNQPLRYASPYRINAFSPSKDTSPTVIQYYIKDAIANDEWVILVFHKIVASPTVETEYSISNFQATIDFIAASGIECAPMSEVIANNTDQQKII